MDHISELCWAKAWGPAGPFYAKAQAKVKGGPLGGEGVREERGRVRGVEGRRIPTIPSALLPVDTYSGYSLTPLSAYPVPSNKPPAATVSHGRSSSLSDQQLLGTLLLVLLLFIKHLLNAWVLYRLPL